MGIREYSIKRLCEEYSKELLAEKFLIEQELRILYTGDNNELRKENESLKYLIAKYSMAKSEVADSE